MGKPTKPEMIDVRDLAGEEICLGDIVEFWTCAFHGIQSAPFKNSKTCGARCVDVICRHDEESPIPGHKIGTYFAMSPVSGGGLWAKRLDGICKVVGKFPEDAKLLVAAMPMAPQEGPECDKLVEKLRQNPLVLKNMNVDIRP